MLSNAIRCSSGSRYVHREFAYKKAKGGGVYIASDVSFATRLRRTSALEKKGTGYFGVSCRALLLPQQEI